MRDSVGVAIFVGITTSFVLFLGSLLLMYAPLLTMFALLGGVLAGLLVFIIDRRTDTGE